MTRATRRAADLIADDCTLFHTDRGEHVRVVQSAYTVKGKTTVVFADGEPIRVGSDVPFSLATQEEVEAADAEADREAFAAALDRFADRVIQARLPVPHRDKRIHIGLDLDHESDVQAWSRWLASNPQQGTSRLVVLAEVEGVEVMVRGPEGSTGEFGPDLADAALTESVEHRDSVGAFPVVASSPWTGCGRCGSATPMGRVLCTGCVTYLAVKNVEEMRAEEGEPTLTDEAEAAIEDGYDGPVPPERDGFAPPSGHAAVLPPDALKHDGRYDDPKDN